MATHYCDKCMATANLDDDLSKKPCDQPPHHFVPIVSQPAVQQFITPPALPAVIQPLPVLSTAPSKINSTEVDKFRDLNVYSPTSNIFVTKAHILAYSRPLLGPPTEKTARLLTRTLVDLKSLIIGESGSSEHPIEPYGYCSQMAMNEQGVTALLTANISKCVASHLSDNSDHYPSIVEEQLYIMHQSCSKVGIQHDFDIDVSFYYRFMRDEVQRSPQKSSVLFPMAFVEFGKSRNCFLHQKYPKASAYANHLVQLMALKGFSKPWVPILGVVMTDIAFVVQLHVPSVVDGRFKLARVDVAQYDLDHTSLSQLLHIIVGWIDLCVSHLRVGWPNEIALPVNDTNICCWENKIYKSYDYRAISGKHTVAEDTRRDCSQYFNTRILTGVELVVDFVSKIESLQIICYDKVPGTHLPCYVGHFTSLLSSLLALHRQGIVHGDIRFSNVIFSAADDEVVKATMIDFDFSGVSGEKRYPTGFNLRLDDGFRHADVCEGDFIRPHHDIAAARWMGSHFHPDNSSSSPDLMQLWSSAFEEEAGKEEDTDLLSTTVEMLVARPEFMRVALQLKKPNEAPAYITADRKRDR